MNTMKALLRRKSVRTYTGVPVTDDQRAQLLKAAYASPVAMGQYDSIVMTWWKSLSCSPKSMRPRPNSLAAKKNAVRCADVDRFGDQAQGGRQR